MGVSESPQLLQFKYSETPDFINNYLLPGYPILPKLLLLVPRASILHGYSHI